MSRDTVGIIVSPTKRYLGDGAYVDLDSFGGVVLTAEDGISATDTIVLEPEVISAFVGFLRDHALLPDARR